MPIRIRDSFLPNLESGKYLTNDGSKLLWGTVDLSGYVPYTGATSNVDLGLYTLNCYTFTSKGLSNVYCAIEKYSTALSASLQLRRSNSDTLGTKTITTDTQTLGTIGFYGIAYNGLGFPFPGNDWASAGSIYVAQDGNTGDFYVPGKIYISVTGAVAPSGASYTTTISYAAGWDFAAGNLTTTGTTTSGYFIPTTNYKSVDGTVGGTATTGGLTFKNGLYTTGSASSVSFGTTTQIPYMNVGGTDFLYNAGLVFDGTKLTVLNIIDSGLTASKVVFTDASKQLTSTGIGTSSQFIKGDGSLDSSTYLASSPFIESSSIVQQDTATAGYDEDFVFGSPTLADDTNSAHDSRFWFDESKSAWRAGIATDDSWNDSNVGSYSAAFGYNCVAKGMSSLALGTRANTTASYAVALGYQSSSAGEATLCAGYNASASSAGKYSIVGGDSASCILPYHLCMGIGGTVASGSHNVCFTGLQIKTTDATVTTMLLGGSGKTKFTIASGRVFGFRILVTASKEDKSQVALYDFVGIIKNISGTTTVPTVTKTVLYEDDATWDCDVAADDTDDELAINVTGVAATNIQWTALVTYVHFRPV